jgi:hypothetical protein
MGYSGYSHRPIVRSISQRKVRLHSDALADARADTRADSANARADHRRAGRCAVGCVLVWVPFGVPLGTIECPTYYTLSAPRIPH